MLIGVVKESFPGEKRVAVVPNVIRSLTAAQLKLVIESGAGAAAGFSDSAYQKAGAEVVSSRTEVFAKADILLQVQGFGTHANEAASDLPFYKQGQTVIALMDPLYSPTAIQTLGSRGVTSFSLEFMPRTSRAQSMDVLSAMGTISGYKAVLLAAHHLPKMFPMLMTAAGTVAASKVLVIGAGVAGLQAIATAKRLGALVSAYDLRPAVKEQVESLGAKFVELPLETKDTETKGGYAKAMDEDFYKKQQALMKRVVAENDVVITTALIPGKKAPILITQEMVEGMTPGSIIVDIAAERGGNCELTQPQQTTMVNGVTILGPTNLPSSIPFHASQLFAKTITTFLLHLVKNGQLQLDQSDDIVSETLLTLDGDVVHPRIRELLKLSPTHLTHSSSKTQPIGATT